MKTIALTKGLVTKVDDSDYEFLSQWKWRAQLRPDGSYCAARTVHSPMIAGERESKTVLMHRVIMGEPPNLVVDHRNGDALDNQRGNLRNCLKRQNCQNQKVSLNNTSGFKGVTLKTGNGLKNPKWNARIGVDGKRFHIGYYDEPKLAARMYDSFAVLLFGEFASLNFGYAS